MFPFHHPRQRQLQSSDYSHNLNERIERTIIQISSAKPLRRNVPLDDRPFSDTLRTVDLISGDVLYVPPLWIHTGTSLGLSITLGTCSASDVERYIDLVEHLILPVEYNWSFRNRMHALLLFIDVISKEFSSTECWTLISRGPLRNSIQINIP